MVLRNSSRSAVTLFFSFLLATFLSPRSARAEPWLESYTLDVQVPDDNQASLGYTLTLVYRTPPGESKHTGFKFVGREPVMNLKVTDAEGNAMDAKASLETSSHEYKIDFNVPYPDTAGQQTVKISFDQWLPRTGYGWTYENAPISWASTFKIPVHATETTITGPRGMTMPYDFTCTGSDPVKCSRREGHPSAVAIRFPSPVSAMPIMAMLIVLLVVSYGMVRVVQSRYRELLTERGVLPPASTNAYPTESQGYRAPPPLPVEEDPTPILPPEERAGFINRVILGAGALVFMLGMVAIFGSGYAPLPMPVMMMIVAPAGAVIAGPFISAQKTRVALPIALVLAAIVLPIAGSFFGMLWALFPVAFAGIEALSSAAHGIGISNSSSSSSSRSIISSSSSSSSSCSSSSCSSSSSSSCGGGGGGCGGGGGGGGCGG